MHQNSKFYSGLAPRRIKHAEVPHVTVQRPVYKEGFYCVIDPTIKSLKAAISTYEMQGGRANIFINDDGMQLISLKMPRSEGIIMKSTESAGLLGQNIIPSQLAVERLLSALAISKGF